MMIPFRNRTRRGALTMVTALAVVAWSLTVGTAMAAVPAERSSLKIGEPAPATPANAGPTPARGRKLAAERERRRAAALGEGDGCRRLPASHAIVKLNLKPETDIVDLVAWISSITCRQFLLPGDIVTTNRKITVYAPQLITPDSAYRLFLSALDSVGLTVQESGRFFRIIETAKAKTSALPLYGFDGQLLPQHKE